MRRFSQGQLSPDGIYRLERAGSGLLVRPLPREVTFAGRKLSEHLNRNQS